MENRARLWKPLSDEGILKNLLNTITSSEIVFVFFLNLSIEVNQVQMLKGVIK